MLQRQFNDFSVQLLKVEYGEDGKRVATVLISCYCRNNSLPLAFGFGLLRHPPPYQYAITAPKAPYVFEGTGVYLLEKVDFPESVTHFVVGPATQVNAMKGIGIKIDEPTCLLSANATPLEKILELTFARIFDFSMFIHPMFQIDKASTEFLEPLTTLFSAPKMPTNYFAFDNLSINSIQRELIKDSIKLHRRAGTEIALRKALRDAAVEELNGVRLIILEWWQISEYLEAYKPSNPALPPNCRDTYTILIAASGEVVDELRPNPEQFLEHILKDFLPISIRYIFVQLSDWQILEKIDHYVSQMNAATQ